MDGMGSHGIIGWKNIYTNIPTYHGWKYMFVVVFFLHIDVPSIRCLLRITRAVDVESPEKTLKTAPPKRVTGITGIYSTEMLNACA